MTRRSILALTAVGALTLSLAAVPSPAAAAEPEAPLINGYRNIGYYGQWQAASAQEATMKKLFIDTDLGANLTHLNYSFGNIAGSQKKIDEAIAEGVRGLDGVDPYTCFISDQEAPAPGETDTAGEAEADFLRLYTAEESVLGIADTRDQALAGSLNQLRQVQRLFPDLKIHVSLGGWSWSKSFSDAVATPERRTNLVNSCIDLWIHGNLPEIDRRGGEGAAAGIITGFDLDWEWPGAPDWAQEVGNSVDPENDKANFLAFTKELRETLDATTAETGQYYEISAFLPAGGTQITAGGWNEPEFFQYLDFGNLQGYDFVGPWALEAGHQGNIYGDPEHNWGLGLDTVLASYVDNGIEPEKLNLGMAAYSYGWRGVDAQPWSQAESIATQPDGTAVLTWDRLQKERPNLEIHHEYTADGKFNASWGYDAERREFWTFDDPTAVTFKTQWAIDNGLGGVDFWELAQDTSGELAAASAAVLRAAETGPGVGKEITVCDADPWNARTIYTGGERVFLDGKVFQAQWWTQGDEPGKTTYGSWTTVAGCGTVDTIQPWFADTVYHAGDLVTHDGDTWTAKWWTRNQAPGAESWGPWEKQ